MGGTASQIWAATRRGRLARLLGAALVASATWLLGAESAPSLATTTSVSVTQGSFKLASSASPRAGNPVTITESGQVGVTSTLQVYAQVGQPCAASQGEEAAIGALHVDQRVITGSPTPFSVTSQFMPTAAGTYFICGYLDGASGGTSESQSTSIVVVVAPAPPLPSGSPPAPGPGPATGPASTPSASRPCVVPALSRHSLAGARHLLQVAGCSLGVVLQPSSRGLSRARSEPGGRSLVLVVGSQFPAAGTELGANQDVTVRLVLGKPPGSRAKTGTR